jgi:gliding motility-associated-like protein
MFYQKLTSLHLADSRIWAFALTVIFTMTAFFANSQDLPEFNMSNTTISDCQGILYDSGGPDNPYGMNENITTVINPGGVITITFTGAFALELNLDSLYIYNGPNASSPLLGSYTGQTLPPTLVANSGAVTFVMSSDNNIAGSGFSLEWDSDQPIPIPPNLSVNNVPACNASQVNLNLSTPVQCAWLATAVFSVTAGGQDIPVSSVQPNCAGGQTSVITLVLAQPFSFNCNYTIHLDIEIPDNCGVIYPFALQTTFLFQNCGVNANITSSSNTVCPGQCAELYAEVQGCFTYTYAWNNGLPATAGPHQVCPTVQTTYSVTITEVETASSVVKTYTLGIETIDIITNAQTVCQSAPDISLQATGVGEWSGAGVVGINTFDPDQANAGVNYVYFQTAGCLDSVAITVTAIATQDVTAACPGSAPFQLQATPTGGTWSGPNTDASGMFDPTTAGTFVVDYAVNGCTDILTVNVADITGSTTLDPVCQSVWLDTISFAPYGGSWSGAGIVNEFLGIYAPQDMTPGNHQFVYSINGCDQIFDVLVKSINIDSYHTACPTEAPLILDTTPIPTGGTWSSPDGAISNISNGTFNPAVIPNDSYTYILYQAPNGCVDTMFIYVLQTVVEVDELAFCTDDPQVALNTELTGDALPDGGVWSGPGVSGNSGTGYFFNPAVAGIGQHSVVYLKNDCSDQIVVTVFPANIPETPLNFCSSQDPLTLLPSVLPGGTWSGEGITDASIGTFDPGAATPGTFFVYWTSPAGCSDSVSVTVEEEQVATITGLDEAYCMQDINVNFTGAPDGGILLGSLSTFSFNPSLLGEGSYQVIYKYTPTFCPQSSDTVNFVVYPPMTLTLTASDELICDDQSVTLTATVTGGNTANGYTYTWTNGGFAVSTNTSVPGVATTIGVTVNDNCSPAVSDDIFIDVVPPMLVAIDTSGVLCAGQQGWVTADVALPIGTFSTIWNNTIDSDTLFANAGTSWQLTVNDLTNACTSDFQGVIPAYPTLTANFSITPNDDCIAFEDMGSISFIDLSQNGITGEWDFGNGATATYVPGANVNQAYSSPGNITVLLSIENEGGCTSEISKNICILPSEPLFVPDIFSPNGDKHNDTLFVRGFGVTKLEFHLYDRWGEEVFSTSSVDQGWDGQLRGQPASSGSYFYTLRAYLGNDKTEKSGEIVLVR